MSDTNLDGRFTRAQILRAGLLCLLFVGGLPRLHAQVPDPSLRGAFATTSAEYNLGDTAFTPPGFPAAVELRGVVFHPTNLAAGPFPLVVFLHGRHSTCFLGSSSFLEWPCSSGRSPILSFRGYDYAADHLASHGYVVVSISANGINARDNGVSDAGALARAQLIHRHLDQWRTYNTTGAAPFGTQFVGALDLTRVGTMGHSRGGEGVARHYLYNATQASPYPVKLIVPIAPTNFSRWQLPDGSATAQLLAYCDGDVSNLQGVHFYDDARHRLTTAGFQQYVTVLGANHNYFNSNWTPGSSFPSNDDWSASSDPFCGTGVGNGRLSAAQQRAVGLNYLTALFRYQVGGESALLPLIDGSGGLPPALASVALHVSFQGAEPRRRDVNRLLTASALSANFLGGAVSQSGLTPYELCGGAAPQPTSCVPGQAASREPHFSSAAAPLTGLSQLRTGWGVLGAAFTNDIPAGSSRDVSAFDLLQFRAAVNFTDGRNAAGQPQDLSVRLTDGAGTSQALRVGQFSNALFYPPGTTGAVPKVLANTVRVPLAAFTQVDRTNLARVELLFDRQPSGALLVSDLHFYRGSGTPPSPDFTIVCAPSSTSIPQGGSATSTCTLTSLAGFSGSVNLACGGLPAGATCAFSTNPVVLAAAGSATSALTLAVAATSAPGSYALQATATSGSLTRSASLALTITSVGSCVAQTAAFDTTARAPGCATVGLSCDSGPSLLLGRGTRGPESNAPNTIGASCVDGNGGTFHSDESLDRLRVVTQDGSCLARGKTVRVEATVWAWTSPTADSLDVYFAPNAAAPVWQFVTTLIPTVVGAQTLSTTFAIPAGASTRGAFRGQFRYQGSASACTAGTFNDRDDLVFVMQ